MQFVAGGIAGTSEICVMYPLDVVKTRFQLQVTTPSRLSGPVGGGYTSILDCFKKIIQQEGPTKLYRGILAPIMIEAPKRAVKFASNEQYTRLYKGILPNVSSQKLSIATGVSAGLTEALIVVSFELIKIRMQDKQNASLYKNTLDCVKKIYQLEGGLFAFTRGLEATLWRHASWNGAYFGVIHGVREALPKAEVTRK